MYIGPWQEYKLAKIASQTPSVETVEAYYAQWKELSQKIGTEEATKLESFFVCFCLFF